MVVHPWGAVYNASPAGGVESGPGAGCYPIYHPALPGAPDDIVTFDGAPEQIRTLVNFAVPVVQEQQIPLGGGQTQLIIQMPSAGGQPLYPGGLMSFGNEPLTAACFLLGNEDPLNYSNGLVVRNATITYFVGATLVAGPFNVTGSVSTPWDGTLEHTLGGAAGSPINRVRLELVVLKGECIDDLDCADGDPCTIDECINFVCVNTPDPDPCCGVNCNDGDPCTIDTRVNGDCYYAPILCDDGDCCTIDECVNGQCVYTHVRNRVPTQHAARRAFHKAHVGCLNLGGSGCGGGGGGGPPNPPNLDDLWTTHPACDGETRWRIGLDPGDPPIPADFFDPGSEPFTGTIVFRGEPLGIPGFPDTDTVVRRSAEPFDRADPPSPTPVTVDIELLQLSLMSCQPITVIVNGNPTLWDVFATVSNCAPPLPRGDLNSDGFVRGDDVGDVVDCILAGSPPAGVCVRAGIDQNGVVDHEDTPGLTLLLMELN